MSSFTLDFLHPSIVERAIITGWRTYEKCFIGDVLVKDIVNSNHNYINFINRKLDDMVSNNFIDNYMLTFMYMVDMFSREPVGHPITIFPDFIHGRNIKFNGFYVHPGYNRILIFDLLEIEYIQAIYFTSREYYPLFIKDMVEIDPLEYASKFENCKIEIYPFAGSLVPQFRFSSNKQDFIHHVYNNSYQGDEYSKYEEMKLMYRQRLEKRLKILPSEYKGKDIVDFLLKEV